MIKFVFHVVVFVLTVYSNRPGLWFTLQKYTCTCFIFQKYPCFWPNSMENEQKFGPIGVRYLGCQKQSDITIRAFSIRKVKTY